MKILKCLVTAASLLTLSGAAQATLIDFVNLANTSLGESAWTNLMFKADGTPTTTAGEHFLSITATNGKDSFAYLDSNYGGLGACGALKKASDANTAFPGSGTNRCDPPSDDNISNNGTPETVHFVFAGDVIIDTVVLNNNHDGDRSLLDDFVIAGLHTDPAVRIDNGGYRTDSILNLRLAVAAGDHFDVGFYPADNCYNKEYEPNNAYADCELYIGRIKFSDDKIPPEQIPEPTTLALLSLGLIGLGAARRRQK